MSMSILEVTFSSVVQWKHVGLILICGTPRSTDRNRPELHFLSATYTSFNAGIYLIFAFISTSAFMWVLYTGIYNRQK